MSLLKNVLLICIKDFNKPSFIHSFITWQTCVQPLLLLGIEGTDLRHGYMVAVPYLSKEENIGMNLFSLLRIVET